MIDVSFEVICYFYSTVVGSFAERCGLLNTEINVAGLNLKPVVRVLIHLEVKSLEEFYHNI